ncbi:MAG: outer membrane lipoprotein-sorting protein, partial [Chthoniobacterales bacterium]|nr:outer membrane lipoprotein-sorting protein [Chthoniobacterales bacterium]
MKNKLIHRAPNGCQAARHDREHRLAKQAIHAVIAGVFVVACTLVRAAEGTPAAAPQAPSAQAILASVRMQQTQQEIDLQGQLRENEIVVPFRLTQTGPIIKYSFANPAEALQLRLGENDSRLEELSSSGVAKITPAQFDRKVRGTAVTYEDLALKFLYWPDGRVLGEDSIRTRNCWKLQLRAPAKSSQYANVVLWV